MSNMHTTEEPTLSNPTEQEYNSELISFEQIEGTPFTLRKFDDKFILTIGRYKHSRTYTSREEALEDIDNPSWDLMVFAILSMNETIKDIENETKK